MDIAADRSDLIRRIDCFREARVLCIGDVMLDRFVYGQVERISPEAPIPIIRQQEEKIMLGGAGNVVRNLSALGASSCFLSVVGDDDTGRAITRLTGQEEGVQPFLTVEKGRPSTEKIRYIAAHQQMFRVDRETTSPPTEPTLEKLTMLACDALKSHQAVICSDYGKGMLAPALLEQVISRARELKIPVIIDPKSRDFSRYRGATILTPNLRELEAAAGQALATKKAVVEAARRQIETHGFDAMLVTRGSRGMSLIEADGEAFHVKAEAREIFDVSGAGDTALACLSTALVTGFTLQEAVFLANIAAGIVVGRAGTAVVYRTELKSAVHTQAHTTGKRKIFSRSLAADQVEAWKREGLSVGFTNGCFDLVHAGHLDSLTQARNHCDRLIVALNSDYSVRRLKGEDRPINAEMDRAMLLAALIPVDMVVIFHEDTPEALLELLRPDVLMKGEDYREDEIVGGAFVKSYGGRIVRIPLREGYSTTGSIERIISRKAI